jgi:hypothetical protein
VRGVVSTLTKIVEALDAAGIELIGNEQPSQGRGRGVRLKEPVMDGNARDAAARWRRHVRAQAVTVLREGYRPAGFPGTTRWPA